MPSRTFVYPRLVRSLCPVVLALALAACQQGGGDGTASGTGGSGGTTTATAMTGGTPGSASGTGGSSASSGGQAGQGSGGSGAGGVATGGAGGSATGTGGSPAGTGGASDAGEGSDLAPATDAPGNPGAMRSPGCTSGQGLPEGDATLMAAGMMRSYRVHLPRNYSKDKAWPLVLALHPNGGSGIGFYEAAGRNPRPLLQDKAVLILPLARGGGGDWDWRGNLPADLAYFDALMTKAKTELCLDETRLFSMGFSGGASFSGVLACARKDIRAIAVAGSVIYFDPKTCVGNPAAWMAIGQGELIAGRTAFRDYWIERATCKPPTMPTPPSPCVAYTCPSERPVHYCQHGGGHEWPDFATAAAVAFFDRF
jgi:polyhydroxybutyrate depolymerase